MEVKGESVRKANSVGARVVQGKGIEKGIYYIVLVSSRIVSSFLSD